LITLSPITRPLYCIAAIGSTSGVIYAVYNLLYETGHPVATYMIILTWLCLVAIGYDILRYRDLNRIISIMVDECRVLESIELLIRCYKMSKGGSRKKQVALQLVSAYSCFGDNTQAKRVLDEISELRKKEKPSAASDATYILYWLSWNLNENRLEQAIDCLEQVKAVISSGQLRERDHYQIIYCFMEAQMAIHIKQGNYAGSEFFYRAALLGAQNLLNKVSCMNALGKTYLHYERFDEARDAFSFVVQNGGDSYYVEKAKQQLLQLDGEASNSVTTTPPQDLPE